MNAASHDDFSRAPVANYNLRPWWYLLIIEMGVMISIPVFLIGGQLGLGLTFHDLIFATFFGAIILGIIGGLTARLGALTRCSTALIAKVTFGQLGTSCIAILLAIGMTGWWGVQTELFANAVIQLANQLFHCNLPKELMIIIGGGAMIVTASLGIRAIGRLSYFAVPLLSIGLLYALYTIIKTGSFNTVLQYHPSTGSVITFGAAAAIVASGFIVGASMNPDYARFAFNKKHAFAYAFSDYALVYPILLIISGIIAIAFQTKDIMLHLVPPGYTWLIFVMMMFATWAANDCNLYSSSLSLAAVLPKLQRAHLAIIAGLFGILLAEFNVAEHMISFLTLLGIFIAPISGVFIINALGRKHPVLPEELTQITNWKLIPLAAWACGALIGYLTTPRDALGLGLFQITTVPTLDAVIGASAAMFIINLTQRNSIRIPDSIPDSQIIDRSLVGAIDDTL